MQCHFCCILVVKHESQAGRVVHVYNQQLRQKDCKFKASMGNLVRPCIKIKNEKGWGL
jgi:hypothetical protein